MAKRRNAKKEKAIRNKLNARKFRKPSSRRTGRYRRYQNNNEENKSDEDSNTSEPTPTKQSQPSEKSQAKTQIEKTQKTQQRSVVPKPHISENKVTSVKSE